MEVSKRAKQIPITGLLGNYQGFINSWAGGTQTVGISGPFIFNASGVNTTGITMSCVPGQFVPIACTYIQPTGGPVTALLP